MLINNADTPEVRELYQTVFGQYEIKFTMESFETARSVNRDPRAFADPDRCILDRHPNRHVAFGHGRHLCLGANLARLELTIMIERFAELFPDFRVDPTRPPPWKPRGDLRALATLALVA